MLSEEEVLKRIENLTMNNEYTLAEAEKFNF